MVDSPASRSRIFRRDYSRPSFLTPEINLTFVLSPTQVEVTNRSRVVRQQLEAAAPPPRLELNAMNFEVLDVLVDGRPARWHHPSDRLTLDDDLPAEFTLQTRVRFDPRKNVSLEGLYASGALLCTQCEAHGFRHVTPSVDRPDNMARFTVTIEADRATYPVLLSNGNLVTSEDLGGGWQRVRWVDPHPKPSYLFALVAGDLARVEGEFQTRSGRKVALELYASAERVERSRFALECLQRSMRWDEERFGLEYDLDRFMIVAVDDFNMGAMENKGLNIFNAQYLLADPTTATDGAFRTVDAIVAHEYFHNWTGNRVTCRDWFQLSLKEGLTVYRDQEYTADTFSRAVSRIDQVSNLRDVQFPEDAGPSAHPVRPDSCVSVDNFYTPTVYDKGAEVVRMMATTLGREGFRRGMDRYFELFDGQAVTIEDFLHAMESANGRDLSLYRRWYAQSGTPRVHVEGTYDPTRREYRLSAKQSCPPTPGQVHKETFPIPLRLGLLSAEGQALPLRVQGHDHGTEHLWELQAANEEIVFENIPAPPIPSLLRGFSAPVRLEFPYAPRELALLFRADPDLFNRWEAGQRLFTDALLSAIRGSAAHPLVSPEFRALIMEGFQANLHEVSDPLFASRALGLPSFDYLQQFLDITDPGRVVAARFALRDDLAACSETFLLDLFARLDDRRPYAFDPAGVGRRAFRGLVLAYLAAVPGGEHRSLALRLYREADNMSDRMAALYALNLAESPERDEALAHFRTEWQHDKIVINQWIRLVAAAPLPSTPAAVREVLRQPFFDAHNPNHLYSLLYVLGGDNPAVFHEASGEVYTFLADQVLDVDRRNPQVAARIVGAFDQWRCFEPKRAEMMHRELQRMADAKLSPNTFEIVSQALAATP
jgi:aminopeptidase N